MIGRGFLLVFEGIDGSGKSTQVELLARALRAAGETVVTSKEPTDGEWGRRLRESAVCGRMSLDEELAAFVMDRKEHVNHVIQPALDAGQIVIVDRYFYSTIAYQGIRGADPADVRRANLFAPRPAMVFVVDIDPAVSLRRIAESRGNGPDEFETIEQLTQIRQRFDQMTDANIWVVDGSQTAQTVHASVLRLLVYNALLRFRCGEEFRCQDPVLCRLTQSTTCPWYGIIRSLGDAIPTTASALIRCPGG